MSSVSPTSSTVPTTPVTSTADPTSSLGSDAFLQLLVAELKNQDPTQPMDGKDMVAQLAQMNQTQFTQQLVLYQQESLASSMIGKSVTGTLNGQAITGVVSDFTVQGSSVMLTVNGQPLNVTSVLQVKPADAATTTTTTDAPTSTDGANNA